MFLAQIIVLNHPHHIHAGYRPIIHCHTSSIPCKFNKLVSKIDPQTKKVLEENPKFIKARDAAMVEIVPLKPMVVETFASYARLGRFAIRSETKMIIGVGIVLP